MRRPGKMVRQALDSVLRKPATVMYPAVKVEMPDKFRGKLKFDSSKCIGCKMCMRDCPSNAITIVKVGEKRFECQIDCSKCIYCAQCVDSCPKDALEATGQFELASLDRVKLKVTYHAPPAPAAPPTDLEPSKKA